MNVALERNTVRVRAVSFVRANKRARPWVFCACTPQRATGDCPLHIIDVMKVSSVPCANLATPKINVVRPGGSDAWGIFRILDAVPYEYSATVA